MVLVIATVAILGYVTAHARVRLREVAFERSTASRKGNLNHVTATQLMEHRVIAGYMNVRIAR